MQCQNRGPARTSADELHDLPTLPVGMIESAHQRPVCGQDPAVQRFAPEPPLKGMSRVIWMVSALNPLYETCCMVLTAALPAVWGTAAVAFATRRGCSKVFSPPGAAPAQNDMPSSVSQRQYAINCLPGRAAHTSPPPSRLLGTHFRLLLLRRGEQGHALSSSVSACWS